MRIPRTRRPLLSKNTILFKDPSTDTLSGRNLRMWISSRSRTFTINLAFGHTTSETVCHWQSSLPTSNILAGHASYIRDVKQSVATSIISSTSVVPTTPPSWLFIQNAALDGQWCRLTALEDPQVGNTA